MALDITTCSEDLCSTIAALNEQILNGTLKHFSQIAEPTVATVGTFPIGSTWYNPSTKQTFLYTKNGAGANIWDENITRDSLNAALASLVITNGSTSTSSNTRKNITWASKSGHNFCAFVMDGEIYTTNGTLSNSSSQSGRGISYVGSIGLNNLKKLIIPNNSGLKKIGHSGCTSYALYNDGKFWKRSP